MGYRELAAAARGHMGPVCKACPTCNGRACGGGVPGPGAKGSGTVAIRNFEAWERWRLVMDTLYASDGSDPDPSCDFLGRRLSLPLMVAPLGDVHRHYGDELDDLDYNGMVLRAAKAEGTLAWTGDGLRPEVHERACGLIAGLGGAGIPTIKPWSMGAVLKKLEPALAAHPAAVAMDVDGAGLPFLRGQQPPAGPKDVAQLRELADACHGAGVPFVAKGILGPRGALKALEAGVDAIVVSNHGGRVLDGVPATAEVLPSVVDAVGGELCVLVDGGIRSGVDLFRALALGADAALVCRPVAVAAFGGREEGVRAYLAQLRAEFVDAMAMCGARGVAEVTRDMLLEV